MQITETGIGGVAVVALEGRLDSAMAPLVEARLVALAGERGLVLDLAAVVFISSTGLRVLLLAAKVAKAAGRGVTVCALRPAVREVFQISGFHRIIPVLATRDEAVAALCP